jgi:hypothetical protein
MRHLFFDPYEPRTEDKFTRTYSIYYRRKGLFIHGERGIWLLLIEAPGTTLYMIGASG